MAGTTDVDLIVLISELKMRCLLMLYCSVAYSGKTDRVAA
jgi:hypothetical protein